ncbi:MAG: hypothetical protein WBW25_05130, partial [Halobacteriota archaeon]
MHADGRYSGSRREETQVDKKRQNQVSCLLYEHHVVIRCIIHIETKPKGGHGRTLKGFLRKPRLCS